MVRRHAASPGPLVSVVVPARNEERHIGQCVSSIQRTEWPAEQLEILVIDHFSSDATSTVAHAAGAVVLQHVGGNISSVRNRGLNAANGEFVAYVDADCTVSRTWLHSAISLLEHDPRIGAVGGPCLCPENSTWVERSFAPIEPCGKLQEARSLATSSFVARTSVLRQLGYFDESLVSGEDDAISARIRERGLILVSTPDCHIVHYGYPRTWWGVVFKERWHGSNQLESRLSIDANLVLTHLFLFATLALVPLLALRFAAWSVGGYDAFLGAICAQFLPPLFYALKKLRSRKRDWRLTLPWLAIGYAYYLGRAWGLLGNYWRRYRVART